MAKRCEIEYNRAGADLGDRGIPCGEPAIGDCQGCGQSVCKGCSEKCGRCNALLCLSSQPCSDAHQCAAGVAA